MNNAVSCVVNEVRIFVKALTKQTELKLEPVKSNKSKVFKFLTSVNIQCKIVKGNVRALTPLC